MKFISKNANLCVVLSPGIPGEKLTGRTATGMKSARFQQGVVYLTDPEWIKLMLTHPGFNRDFITVEDESVKDPYANTRKNIEPEHNVIGIEYGHVGKNLNPKSPIALTQEQKILVTEMAKKMAVEMAKVMLKDTIKEYLAEQNKDKKDEAGTGVPPGGISVKKRGRPKKQVEDTPVLTGVFTGETGAGTNDLPSSVVENEEKKK